MAGAGTQDEPTTSGGVSRRRMIAGAGLAVAGGALAVGAPASAVDASALGGAAIAAPAVNAVEFRGRIAQTGASGETFTGVGFLTKVAGLASSSLFAGSPQNVSTALFTLYASGDLVSRVLDQRVHSLDIVGAMTIFERSAAGADFADATSFQQGKAVARLAMTLQDVLAVFAPAQGIPTLSGDVRQTFAARTASGAFFGYAGLRSRLLATGLGTLVDPVTLNAQLEMAGNWALT
jgi:hypothetical protein